MNGEALDDRRVSVDREEHSALMAAKDTYDDLVVANAKSATRNHDLLVTCDAQARRLAEVDLTIHHQARVNELQHVFINLLRAERPRVASLEDLSEFWRQWVITTGKVIEKHPQQREAVAKLEPDLFRSWGLWIRDAEHAAGRSLSVAGTVTRADVDAQLPASQGEAQNRVVGVLRETNAVLAARVRELEGEVEAYRAARSKGG